MAVAATTIFAGVSAAASLGKAVHGAISSGKKARRARNKAKKLEKKLAGLEASRQEVINPFDNFSSLSDMIVDVSSEMSNPYNTLSVATSAAEFQAEEADIALANTLDTLQASGASAGGATALAQAALQSKRGISASIEQQEAQNEMMKAQGEERLAGQQLQERQRVQMAGIEDAKRTQLAESKGRMYEWEAKEDRQTAELDRVQAQITGQEQKAAAQKANQARYIGAGIGAVGDVIGSVSAIKGEWDAGSTGALDITNTNQTSNTNINTSGSGGMWSDRRLKKDIRLIGLSPSGLKIYNFKYKDISFGKGMFQGVMSDEIPVNAVIKHIDGYDRVDYSKIDVEFKLIT